MWNIFQNNMPNIISEANVSMYADDHADVCVFVAKLGNNEKRGEDTGGQWREDD